MPSIPDRVSKISLAVSRVMLDTMICPMPDMTKLAFMASRPRRVSVPSGRYLVTSFSTLTQGMAMMLKMAAKIYSKKMILRFRTIKEARRSMKSSKRKMVLKIVHSNKSGQVFVFMVFLL